MSKPFIGPAPVTFTRALNWDPTGKRVRLVMLELWTSGFQTSRETGLLTGLVILLDGVADAVDGAARKPAGTKVSSRRIVIRADFRKFKQAGLWQRFAFIPILYGGSVLRNRDSTRATLG